MNKRDLYDFDVVTVKKYGDHVVKAIYNSTSRKDGVEDDREHTAKGTVNKTKLECNIARARNKVKEYVLCNPWDYWCTLTLSPEKYDRYNLKAYVKDLGAFIRNYNRFCGDDEKVRYILIPEMHKDGAWHMHGFLKGIRKSDLVKNKNGYLTWKSYHDKFGYMSLDTLRSVEKASSYMTKYMSKDMAQSVKKLGAHTYYASKGLKTAELLYKGHARLHCDWDWIHPDGYCKIKTFDTREDDIEEFIEVLP